MLCKWKWGGTWNPYLHLFSFTSRNILKRKKYYVHSLREVRMYTVTLFNS